MPESATQPQSDIPSDTPPVIVEPVLPREEPPAPTRWRVSKSALLLIGGPLAGALLVWLGLSLFSSKPTAPPEVVAEQPAPAPVIEAPPVVETQSSAESQPAMDESLPSAAETEPLPAEPEPLPAAAPEPRQPAETPPSATGEVTAVNEVTPKVPQSALDTIRGTVRVAVRVAIDNDGAVADAVAEDPGPSRYFERLSVDAAKKWTFTPADSADERSMLVKFNFTREGVTAQALELTPQP